jgi:hypothetical protein
VAWVDGAGEITLNAGDYVLLPRGVAHRWTAVGPGETTFLVLTNPGGFEGMFDAIAEATSDPKLPMPLVFEEITKAAARFGVEILPASGGPARRCGVSKDEEVPAGGSGCAAGTRPSRCAPWCAASTAAERA